MNIISEKAEKGEIIYELLEQETPLKPDLIREGQNLISSLKKKQELPTDVLERELKKFSLTFNNNFESNVDSLCMFVAPDFSNHHSHPHFERKTTLEEDSEANSPNRRNKFEMDNRMSFQRRYTADNNLLNFDWQELPSELQTPKKQQTTLPSNEKLDNMLGFEQHYATNNNYSYAIGRESSSPDVLNKTMPVGQIANQSQNPHLLKVPKLDMELHSHQDLGRGSKVMRQTAKAMATTRPSNARSISPLSNHDLSRGEISTRLSTVKKRSIRIPEKYQIVLDGIRSNKMDSADLFDAGKIKEFPVIGGGFLNYRIFWFFLILTLMNSLTFINRPWRQWSDRDCWIFKIKHHLKTAKVGEKQDLWRRRVGISSSSLSQQHIGESASFSKFIDRKDCWGLCGAFQNQAKSENHFL